ncbi:MAG: reductive dehalogenase domain-containing protein [Syntrophobacteraceae bacterium]|jgi:ferredoxin
MTIDREKKRALLICCGSLIFFILCALLIFPWGNGGIETIGKERQIERAETPDLVFNALMVTEYKGPKDKTFVFTGICAEQVKMDLEAQVALEKAVVDDPGRESEQIKALALSFGADLVGIAELNPNWAFKGVNLTHRYAIVIAEAMPYQFCRYQENSIKAAMGAKAAIDFFNGGGRVSLFLADAIRKMGYPARAHYESWSQVMTIPVAIDAGLGEMGRNGLLITPEYGPRCRFSVVTTDLPLLPDKPRRMGIARFCEGCNKCAEACPIKAVPMGSPSVCRGLLKWQVDLQKCFKYWYKGDDSWARCLACMTTCPWNKPDNLLHKAGAFLASRSPLSRWALLKIDDLMNYGAQVDTTANASASAKLPSMTGER